MTRGRGSWLAMCGAVVLTAANASEDAWVRPDPEGKLIYRATASGDVIPDFSHAGYRGGGVALPKAPVRITLEPQEGDNSARIQAALDAVGTKEPDERGLRGVVLLKAGRYELAAPLHILQSGVVLRGEGAGENETLLVATGTGEALITIGSRARPRPDEDSRRAVADVYVPVGARTLSVSDASGFRPGDTVMVHRPSTAEWISALGMDRIPERAGRALTQWTAGSRDISHDRVITDVQGDTITLDAPLVHSLDSRYGGGSVARYRFPGRIAECGVESLAGKTNWDESGDRANPPSDLQLIRRLVAFGAVENAWARNLSARHFADGAVSIEKNAKWITVQDVEGLDAVAPIVGGERYTFRLYGQLSLVQRCRARDGRHDFVTGETITGPNVFLDCMAENAHAPSGPHHRYSVGILYDNVTVDSASAEKPHGGIEIRNRGYLGTGHGWGGANHVAWNCTASWIRVENPPLSQNWAIGCVETCPEGFRPAFGGGMASKGPSEGNGFWQLKGRPASPRSLYLGNWKTVWARLPSKRSRILVKGPLSSESTPVGCGEIFGGARFRQS